MNEQQPIIEIRRDHIAKDHGLCDSAETHWALYLITAMEQGKKLHVHTASLPNEGQVQYLLKGENKGVTGFTFGAESMFIYASTDPALENMIVIQESDTQWMGRPAMDFGEALRLNLFDDPDIESRWKKVIEQFAQKHNIRPEEIDLKELVAQVVE